MAQQSTLTSKKGPPSVPEQQNTQPVKCCTKDSGQCHASEKHSTAPNPSLLSQSLEHTAR
uniref:Uncharacterized protein n=1 Tax=Anguilla anguilla TaxID=7936 RepID=A0A0E9PSH2_ANGAN